MSSHESGVKHLILATAGHVDHGKTALIKALTGTDTDRLPEEKARGITIDLGFAHLALPGLSLGVIDVPGHEDFVRNMIAGIGSIDLALLVVAADDGWMPQTEEHLQILHYLGVRHGVVAITKCDLGRADAVAEQVRQRLQGTLLGEAPIVLTSVRRAQGLEEIKAVLTQLGESIPGPGEIGKPRLFVDRVFTMHGTGTVVTGTLSGGRLMRGETIVLQPQNRSTRIRALQSHNQPLEVALPVTRTAINLPDLRPEEIPRGSVLTTPANGAASHTVDVLLERSGRDFLPARPLKSASMIQIHYGSARFTARIVLLDRRELLPGERAIARLRFATPVFVYVGDRFVLRDSSGRQTVAGGVVLDADAEDVRFRSTAQRTLLQTRAAVPNDLSTLLHTQLARDQVARNGSLLLKSNFSANQIAETIELLARGKKVFRDGEIVADAGWWNTLRARSTTAIDAEHKAHPQHPGLTIAALAAALSISDSTVTDALVADLGRHGFSPRQGMIKRASHRPSLPAALAPAGAKIRTALAAKPFDPPSRKELAPDAAGQQALRFLSESGEVVLLGPEVVLSAQGFTQMKELVRKALQQRGPATASDLRQVLGTSRRVLIPFLEQCDRLGLTTREGDRRKLR